MKVIVYFSEDGECIGSARKSDDYTLQGTEELFAENSSILPDRESQHKQSFIDTQKAQEYARNRAVEYPSNGDQWDMIYKDNKNGTTTHADAVEAVKAKWPKDNSGPK